jgi:intron-binding protein aquarius
LFGRPTVSTVDRYQGQQNDYILLSLVKTRAVGHVRDVRRLIVAMSRARLGLYVFCRAGVFKGCAEIKHVFDILGARGDGRLMLVRGEGYGDDVELDNGKGKKGKGKARKGDEVEVSGVEEMGDFVVEETKVKIAWVKEQTASGNEVVF